jgi:Ankyrin repeats (3 copies)
MRDTLLSGKAGLGQREAWMEQMKQLGVKTAYAEIRGTWRPPFGFRPQSVDRIIYRANYDGPNIQIVDGPRLSKIRSSDLERKLVGAAFDKAKRAEWFALDSSPKNGETCFVNVYLYDDEWLVDDGVWSDSPQVSRYDPTQLPLQSAAAVADKATVNELLGSRRFSQEDLNGALFRAVRYPSDNTEVISVLLRAGADVNAERPDGTTPLMDAAGKLNLTSVRLLLASGADAAKRTTTGLTAYSVAQEQLAQIRNNHGRMPETASEIVSLVGPRDLAHVETPIR